MDAFFSSSTCTLTRGHKFKLYKKQTVSQTRANFFSERVINAWNSRGKDCILVQYLDLGVQSRLILLVLWSISDEVFLVCRFVCVFFLSFLEAAVSAPCLVRLAPYLFFVHYFYLSCHFSSKINTYVCMYVHPEKNAFKIILNQIRIF